MPPIQNQQVHGLQVLNAPAPVHLNNAPAAGQNNNAGVLDSITAHVTGLFQRDAAVPQAAVAKPQRPWQVSPRTRRAWKLGAMMAGAAGVCFGAWKLVQVKQDAATNAVKISNTDWAQQAAWVYNDCYNGDNGTTSNYATSACGQINLNPVGEQPCDWTKIWFWEDNVPSACTEQMTGQMEQIAIDAARAGQLKNYGLLTLLILVPSAGLLIGSAAAELARCAHNTVLPDTQDRDAT
jgi:hypothetical protein